MIPILLHTNHQTTAQAHQEAVLQWRTQQSKWLEIATPHPDFTEINTPGEAITIEQIRHFLEEITYAPHQSEERVFVLYHLDQASVAAQNALLKTLEEPPTYAQIICTISNPEQVLATIRSRCQLQLIAKTETRVDASEKTQSTLSLSSIQNKPHGELVNLAGEYKDRDIALQAIQTWLDDALNKPVPSSDLLQILNQTHTYLQANTNVQLAMEACFFRVAELKNKAT